MSRKTDEKHKKQSSGGEKPHKTIDYFIIPILYALILLIIALPIEFAFKNMINDSLIEGYKNANSHSYYDEVLVDRKLALSDNQTEPVTYSKIAKNEGYGKVFIENVGLNCEVYRGLDSKPNLRYGVASSDTLPGGEKPVYLYGYSNKHFEKLFNAKINDEVVFNTTYGKYIYRINDIFVANEFDESTLKNKKSLIMYCTNGSDIFDSYSDEKLYVVAELVSGPSALEDVK